MHWGVYVDKNDLWWQFARFAEAIKGIDPAGEAFMPKMLEHPRLRIYCLQGKRRSIVWCRDKQATWQAELRDRRSPKRLEDVVFDLETIPSGAVVRAYDPWSDRWTQHKRKGSTVTLPPFVRSLVVRIDLR